MSIDFASESSWTGALPRHWNFYPLGRVSWIRARLGWRGLTADEYVDDGVPMLATPDIKRASINFEGANRITPERYDESPEIALGIGDVLLTKDGATIGICNVVRELPEQATVNGSIAVITPSDELVGEFLYYVIISRYAQSIFDRLRGGMGVPHLFQSDIKRVRIPLPPLDEQRAIADYLDVQTSRIDTLIAKQNQLIDTLRERRMGAIAQALAYGLASGPVSPSGLDWLEFVPSTWRPVQVKNFGDVSLGKMLQPANSGADVRAPYMRAANVQPDGVLQVEDVKEMWFSQKELNGLELLSGDVVVVEGGVGGFGRAAYLSEDLDRWGFQNSILRVRPFDGNDGRYLTYALLLARSSGYVRAYCNIVSMPHFTAEKLASFRFWCPPLGEQREIADYLDTQTFKIDALIAKTQEHIALAKERRAALITAAVTGEFDVRTAARKGAT